MRGREYEPETNSLLQPYITGADVLIADVIRGAYGIAGRLKSPKLEEFIENLEFSPAVTRAYLNESGPLVRFALNSARIRRLPEKKYLEQLVELEFRDSAKIEAVRNGRYRRFPDVPSPHFQVFPNYSYPLRWFEGMLDPDPIFGFPQFPDFRHSWDTDFMGIFYSDSEERHGKYSEILERVFNKILSLPIEIPPEEKDAADRIRFLGYPDEESFVGGIETTLLSELSSLGINTDGITDAMEFAKYTDMLREQYGFVVIDRLRSRLPPDEIAEMTADYHLTKGKRRTGESYYCHYLASAWMLWQFIKNDLKEKKIDPKTASVLIEFMFKHDLVEDLDARVEGERLVIDFPEKKSIRISALEAVLLDKFTKKDGKGVSWFEDQIMDISDPVIRRFLARLKTADRLPSLLTMSMSPGRSFLQAGRKIAETIFTGGQLALIASDMDIYHPIKAEKRLEMEGRDGFGMFVASIPIIARMEYQILKNLYVLRMKEELKREALGNRWALELTQMYEYFDDLDPACLEKYLGDQGWSPLLVRRYSRYIYGRREDGRSKYVLPLWMPRVAALGKYYGIDFDYQYNLIPGDVIQDIFGIRRLGKLLEKEDGQPLTFDKIQAELVRRPFRFIREMDLIRGPVLGSDFWAPCYKRRSGRSMTDYVDYLMEETL